MIPCLARSLPLALLVVALPAAHAVQLRDVGVPPGQGPARGQEARAFHCRSTSQLVSKRLGTKTTRHEVWLTDDRMRFDDGGLTTIVRLDTGEVWIANRERKVFVSFEARQVGAVLLELGNTMARHVDRRVMRTRHQKQVAGRQCTQCRVALGKTPCTVWVEDETTEAFNAVRDLAQTAARKLGGVRSGLVVTLGGLRGLPREVSLGDPKRFALTWTVESYDREPIKDAVFELPAGFRVHVRKASSIYIEPDDVWFLGEVTAAYFATSPAQRHRSLLPREFTLTSDRLLKDFYEGRPGSHRTGVFHWAKPLTFHLAPELWRYPLSGRAIVAVTAIGMAFNDGGLKSYPSLKAIKTPAN